MGPSKTTNNEALEKMSSKDNRILLLSMACQEGTPKLDFDKLAAITGYTVRSAQITYSQARRNLLAAVGETSPTKANTTEGSSTTPTVTPTATPKRKKATTPGTGKPRGKRAKKEESDENAPELAGENSQDANGATDGNLGADA